MSYAIEIDGLKKSYGNHMVLKGLSFQVARGDVYKRQGKRPDKDRRWPCLYICRPCPVPYGGKCWLYACQ